VRQALGLRPFPGADPSGQTICGMSLFARSRRCWLTYDPVVGWPEYAEEAGLLTVTNADLAIQICFDCVVRTFERAGGS
jgi:hypothetical protein